MKRLSALVPVMFTLGILVAVERAFAQVKYAERNAYFGDEHIHPSWLLDAWVFGNRTEILELMGYNACVRFTCAGSWSCYSARRRLL